jgi:hypothetical protein
MERDYTEFKKLLASKLTTKSLSLAVLDDQGDLRFDDFRQGTRKNEIVEIARQTILTAKSDGTNRVRQFPEYMLYKGSDAFLLILPSKTTPNFYIIFCHNGLNVGMTRICVQNTIESFEKRD